jgi:hypothetical protein
MELYESIFCRKSCRKYEPQLLPPEILAEMETAIKGFRRLDPAVKLSHRLTGKTKGMLGVKAPHYLIVSGQGKPGELECAGFLFQQLDLWFSAKGIGSVWLGASKDVAKNVTGRDIITLAFGKPAEPAHRDRDGFKRKPIAEITNAPNDSCVQAAHLAPSGINLQPWFFEQADGQTLVYKRKPKPPLSLMYKLTDLDMGIALCHYALACEKEGRGFTFTRRDDLPVMAGYMPFGVIV